MGTVKVRHTLVFPVFLCCLIGCACAEWDTQFVKSSKTIPSIEIKLSPPENPLPQVSHVIDELEARRIQMEEEMMARLEDRFNETLVESRDKIRQLINQFTIFANDDLKTSILEAIDNKKNERMRKQRSITAPTFLQTDEAVVPSSVRVMMTDVEPPDPVIKTKMEQIEQSRSYEEVQVFHQQAGELDQLTNVTLIELENALKLQLQPYLMHIEKIKSQFPKAEASGQHTKGPSFLQTGSYTVPPAKQLNVKIGQSEDPYPTVEDYVVNMEKKRDAAERNERNTVLAMYLKLVKAQNEMIRDELRIATSKVLSQYGGLVDAAAKQHIRRHQSQKL